MARMSKKQVCTLLGALFLQLGTAQAGAATLTDFFTASEPDVEAWLSEPTRPLKWGDWDYVQLVKRTGKEAEGAPNAHPVQIDPIQLAEVLTRLQCKVAAEKRQLFNEEEVLRLSRAAASALAIADSQEDFVFRTAVRHMDFGLLGQRMVNSGRIFVEGGKLNIIIGTQLSDALLALRSGMQPYLPMDPGTRAKVSAQVELLGGVSPQEKLLRPDWFVLDLKSLPMPVVKAPPAPRGVRAPAAPVAPAATPAPAPVAQPAVVAPPPARPAAQQPQAASPAENKAEERLQVLKRLFDKGLISESEYQQKRAEVLRDL